jgi:hypothetical protein
MRPCPGNPPEHDLLDELAEDLLLPDVTQVVAHGLDQAGLPYKKQRPGPALFINRLESCGNIAARLFAHQTAMKMNGQPFLRGGIDHHPDNARHIVAAAVFFSVKLAIGQVDNVVRQVRHHNLS